MRVGWRPRLSVRGMMAVVAVTAVLLGVYSTRKYGARRSYYLDRAEVYATRSREYAGKAELAKRRAAAFLLAAGSATGELQERNHKWADDELLRAVLLRRVADFDTQRERRFRQAADQPWDPPPPEIADPGRTGP
jgi:hypothetical protein